MSAMFPLQRTVPSGQNSLVLQPLQANSGYKISVTPVYPEGDGPTASQIGRTRKLELWDWSPLVSDRDKHEPPRPRPHRTADCGFLLFRLNTDLKLKMSAYSPADQRCDKICGTNPLC